MNVQQSLRIIISLLTMLSASIVAARILLRWYVDGWDSTPIDIDEQEHKWRDKKYSQYFDTQTRRRKSQRKIEIAEIRPPKCSLSPNDSA